MYQFPIGMEMFSADDEDQWAVIKDAIDSSDYYVIIIGRKYGSIIENGDDAGMSYTEKEFRYAQSTEIPILSFVIKDDAQRNGNQVEADPDKMQKLKAFTDYVKTGRLVSFWSNKDELAREVSTALHKQIDRGKRPGWVRADNVDLEKIAGELAESSRRIRKLEDRIKTLEAENQELKLETSKRVPELSLNLSLDSPDNDEEDDKKHKELFKTSPQVTVNGTGLDIRIRKISADDYSDRYAPLEYDDHAKSLGVTEEEITEYNNHLPSTDMIKEINQYNACLKDIRQNGVAFAVNVNNTGTTKATDVRVMLISEDERFFFYELDKVEEFDKLKLPKLPENPIEKAEKKRQKRLLGFGAFGDTLESLQKLSYFEGISPIIDNVRPIIPSISSPHESITVKDHSVEIDADQVLHPTGETFRRFYMIPSESGTFVLKCIIMCTEFIEPIEQEITINVMDDVGVCKFFCK